MIRLYNDDCLNVLKTIESESVDCVVTDCPYHIVSGGCTNDTIKIARSNRRDSHGNVYVDGTQHKNLGSIFDEFNSNTYMKSGKLFKYNEIEFKEWLPEVYRILKDGTHCYVMINARNLKELQQVAEDAGFDFQQLLIWDKGNAVPNKYYLNAYELILMLRKGRARNINDMGTANILRVPNIMGFKQHPTEKPVLLMQILVENSTNEGELVVDPFMGVGATGVACKRTGRDFIGIEIDEKYYEISDQRINAEKYVEQFGETFAYEQLTLF